MVRTIRGTPVLTPIKELSVPSAMIIVGYASGVLAAQDFFDTSLDGLESSPIAAGGKRIALVAVRFNGIGIPVSQAHTFNEICTDPRFLCQPISRLLCGIPTGTPT